MIADERLTHTTRHEDPGPGAIVALRPADAQATKPKRSRTSTHKVRTGCVTCKKRHVKCDEGRPHCGNCLRGGRQCGGYVQSPKRNPGFGQICWNSKSSPAAVATIPTSRNHHPAASPRAQMRVDPDLLDFRDLESKLYFHEFVGLVQGQWISASSSSNLWDVILPQLSRGNTTLRHAAMAIGALSMWHRQSGYGSLNSATVPALPTAEADAHYFRAIAHYCRCLKLQNQHTSVQDAVFLSILLLCFESLRGNGRAALDHVNHGMALLFSLVADKDSHRILRLAPNPQPILSSVGEMYAGLAPQARVILRDRLGSGMPLPNFTKHLRDTNESMESFLVLLSRLPRPSVDLSNIPARFDSLDEYQRYWSATAWNQLALGPIMLEAMQTSGIVHSMDFESMEKFMTDFVSDPRFTQFYGRSRALLDAVGGAFLPLFNKIMLSDTRSPEYQKAIYMRLQYLSVYVIDNMPQYLSCEILEAQTPLFREFLSLAEIALRMARMQTNPAHQLSLHSNVTISLLLVSFFCRDPVARDQAVEMLRDYPGQDGLIPTTSIYALTVRNRMVERENASEGTAEDQWRRLWHREVVFEDGGDRIVFRYMEKDRETGKWVLVEETADVGKVPTAEVVWNRRPPFRAGKLLMGDLLMVQR